MISDLFLMFYTTFTFVAAVLNQLANSRLIAIILKDSFYTYIGWLLAHRLLVDRYSHISHE